ncbi:protein phosphatase 2C domain-containing protein [Sporosarcina sp. Te-1]|uniref:protein phosphatase 2C domain-containing protein n=1 Tax=Sporosarcina sp. Te-1 TaxID=2818390 RepID=UPI001A9FBD4C|nr:protein phosphatase 2C domain-containing protein [Sporosarcina sp. Te-1]QTD42113.1 protein phosphatase 2C domain-containing protein [Sporosarcina sp. Te-1]
MGILEFSWVGSRAHFVDTISIEPIGHISFGRFGGNSSAGQYKNEDGCLIWTNDTKDWEFAVLLDAHQSAESAELVINQMLKNKTKIQNILSLPTKECFRGLDEAIPYLFQEETFRADCQKVAGETACLIVSRKDKYLWWFSIGDCLAFLFHSELAKLGQYQINQRQFYEWVGRVNTFDQVVPCYSRGVRELRKGTNRILLTTDGLVEGPGESFSTPEDIYTVMENPPIQSGIMELLSTIRENSVRDSTTVICWDIDVSSDVARPSDEG